MINITYFGVLKSILNVTQEDFEWESGTTLDLIYRLRQRGDVWYNALAAGKVFRVVVNDVICYEATPIHKGDRVALLPPVTGG